MIDEHHKLSSGGWLLRMPQRKWVETKIWRSIAGSCLYVSCSLDSLHFLRGIQLQPDQICISKLFTLSVSLPLSWSISFLTSELVDLLLLAVFPPVDWKRFERLCRLPLQQRTSHAPQPSKVRARLSRRRWDSLPQELGR